MRKGIKQKYLSADYAVHLEYMKTVGKINLSKQELQESYRHTLVFLGQFECHLLTCSRQPNNPGLFFNFPFTLK